MKSSTPTLFAALGAVAVGTLLVLLIRNRGDPRVIKSSVQEQGDISDEEKDEDESDGKVVIERRQVRGVFQKWTFQSSKGDGSSGSPSAQVDPKAGAMMSQWLAKARENLQRRSKVVNPNQPRD